MNNDAQFDQLARREADLSALASRGRRRSLLIMIFAFIASAFLVMATNKEMDLSGLIPIGIVVVAGTSYSWAKWQRRPEDSQSVAFVGLDRKRRSATYRSLLRGSRIEDPVALTIVESIHHHLRRSALVAVATMVVIAASTVALVAASGDGVDPWVLAAIIVLAVGVIAGHRWLINRSGVVVGRSQH